MKLAVNLHCLHPPLTGIGRYAHHLLLELLENPRVETVAGVSHRGWHRQREVERILRGGMGYEPAGAVGAGRLRAWLKHRLRARERGRYRDFLYWEPNYLLLPIDNPALVTVHDLSHLRHPEYHPAARLRELRRLPETLRRARSVTTVSEFSRAEIAACFGAPRERVGVVPPAVSAAFRVYGEDQQAAVRARFGLPEKYVLFTGTLEPRKNLPRLLQAYRRLPAACRDEYPLVLAGCDGWGGGALERALAALDRRQVRRLGYVGGGDLPKLVSAATLLVYPSLYEGFGMPILEAMASGTPVLTSNVAAMPEVAAGAARLVDPTSVDAIHHGLLQCLDRGGCGDMIERGLAVAAGYSWRRSAELLVAELARVAGG